MARVESTDPKAQIVVHTTKACPNCQSTNTSCDAVFFAAGASGYDYYSLICYDCNHIERDNAYACDGMSDWWTTCPYCGESSETHRHSYAPPKEKAVSQEIFKLTPKEAGYFEQDGGHYQAKCRYCGGANIKHIFVRTGMQGEHDHYVDCNGCSGSENIGMEYR